METIKLNITQLNTIIKRIIDAEEFLQTISVYGEVSNYKISAGNAYFDIKEDGAQLACIQFGALSNDIHNGDMVLLTGRLNYYVKTGRLSFIANKIEPYGLGDLYKQYLFLKEKLSAEGLFDERYKKQIPKYASKVGVVSSETGAVIRDIIHVAKKKNRFTDIILYPAKVQGVGAEDEIIAGLRYFEDTDVDVVIIARGGGSFEDMAPFNTEKLVREIFACKKPIISAVGHETDFSLSDFASDMRAPTPSVGAEIAFFDYNQAKQSLELLTERIAVNVQNNISQKRDDVQGILNQGLIYFQNLTDLQKNKFVSFSDLLAASMNTIVQNKYSQLENLTMAVEKTNPLNILKSGYAIVSKDGQKVTSIKTVNIDDTISIKLNDGNIDAKVVDKKER